MEQCELHPERLEVPTPPAGRGRKCQDEPMPPETRYARTADGVWIAYQVHGEGNVDLILVSSWLSHLEIYWEQPRYVDMVQKLGEASPGDHVGQAGHRTLGADQSYACAGSQDG